MRTLRTLAVVAACTCLAPFGHADIVIDNWASDTLSAPSGTVHVDANGSASITKTVTNTGTGETVGMTISASTGVFKSTGGMGNEVGVDGPTSGGSGDDADRVDGRQGAESIIFTFNQNVTIKSLNFSDIAWATNGANPDTYEDVLVYIGGVLTHTLFGDEAVITDPGFTGATGAIKANMADDFTGLNWVINASTQLEFRFGADATSFTTQNGWKLDNIGFAVAVPEASSFLFGGLACCAGALSCYWRKRKPRQAKHARI